MTDPIDTLEALPPESPPREAVLASLRLFRYRALAVVLVAVVAILALVVIVRAAGGSDLDPDVEAVLDDARVEFRPVSGTTLIGSVQVTVTELATSPAGNAVRVLFVDVGTPEPAVDLNLMGIRQGNGLFEPNISIQSLGRNEGRTGTAVWLPLDPVLDPIGAVIELSVLPIPQSILDEGGELTSDDGFTGVVTIERTITP